MANLQAMLARHKDLVILLGLLIGALGLLEILPDRVSWFSIEENIKYIYLLIIAIAGFTYHSLYFMKPVPFHFERTVPSRNLSNPDYQRSLAAQRGNTPPPHVNIPKQAPITTQKKPSVDIFEEFNN